MSLVQRAISSRAGHSVVAAVEPLDVRPPPALVDVVRVAFFVGVRVVLAVRRDPPDRSALHRQRAEEAREVLDGFRRLEAAMGQQPVIAQRDPQAARDVGHDDEDRHGAPGEEHGQERGQRDDVDETQPESRAVIAFAAAAKGGWRGGSHFSGLRCQPRRACLQLCLGYRQERLERGLVADREVGQRLAVQRDAALAQAVDQPRVGESFRRAAALMRLIQSERKSRLRTRRSRNA